MTKTETAVLAKIEERLRGESGADPYILDHLADPRFSNWLATWVIAPLEYIQPGEQRDPDLASSLCR